MLIEFIVGDTGGDGHEKTSSIIVESNFDKNKILQTLKYVKNDLGFDIRDELEEYEVSTLDLDKSLKLIEYGIDTDGIDQEEDGCLCFYYDSYVGTILNLVKIKDPSFEYSIIELPSIDVGGYGLFYL